MSDSILIT
ncbi:hypothetical protein D030_4063A, partial [Vibrio parahaemolyticus AQ3810]